MAIKTYKPTTNGRREMSVLVNDEITKTTPEKSLVVSLKKSPISGTIAKLTLVIALISFGLIARSIKSSSLSEEYP